MKKILSLILAALMTVSCAVIISADAANDGAYDKESFAIQFLADHGIFKGVSTDEDVVDPDAATIVRRYQMALFVSRIATGFVDDRDWENGKENITNFTDLDTEPVNKYLGALSFANQKGIIEGRTVDTFDPYGAVTYREALAMLVRTLGYKGLSYPWGIIQKSVELGLTADVDVAYTAPLTRGQVAILVYNALFAEASNGSTLGKTYFDAEYGWSNIVIVSSDKYSMNAEASAKPGYVGFQVLNADGTLQGKTYYVKAADLGLSGHQDELKVGAAYLAMFKLENNDFAKMSYYYDLCDGYVMNIGITDNNGDEVTTQPIKAYADKAGYKPVSKYSTFNGSNYLISDDYIPDNEVIMFGNKTYTVITHDDKKVAIDLDDGNLWTDRDGDGDYEVELYYQADLNRYYRYCVDAQNNLFVDWVSPEEFGAWWDEVTTVLTDKQTLMITGDAIGNDAYAKFTVYDVDYDSYADRGFYKNYKVGYFKTESKKCPACGGDDNEPYYTITDLDGKYNVLSVCADCTAFLNIDSSVKNFTGTESGVVLYNYNKLSGELEIVKYVEGRMDYDSGYVVGLVTAYSATNATITIGGTPYPIGYTGAGVGSDFTFHYQVNEKIDTMMKAAEELDKVQMQYVSATILDGVVIDIDLVGSEKGQIIVSLGYAGYTNDGYIGIYGWTPFGGYDIYKLDSVNGWKRGDYSNYWFNLVDDETFKAGTVLSIRSQNEDAYAVYAENYADKNLDAYASLTDFSVQFVENYRLLNGSNDLEAMTAAHKYVLVYDNGVIITKEGIFDGTGYSISNAKAKKFGDTYVIFVDDNTVITGFDKEANYGIVKFEGSVIDTSYNTGLLQGATQSTVVVTDLMTGATKQVATFFNVDLYKGHVYLTVENLIVEDLTARPGYQVDTVEEIAQVIQAMYSNDSYTAGTNFVVKYEWATKDDMTSDRFWADSFGLLDNVNDQLKDKVAATKIGDCKDTYKADGVDLDDGAAHTVVIVLDKTNKNNYVLYVVD